eukprot:SAG11_NODE_3017_length_2760_cov_2.538519_2_plen_167_part_00
MSSSTERRRRASQLERHFGSPLGGKPQPAEEPRVRSPRATEITTDAIGGVTSFESSSLNPVAARLPNARGGSAGGRSAADPISALDVGEATTVTAALAKAEASLVAATVHAAAHWAGHQPAAGPAVQSDEARCWICGLEFGGLFERRHHCRDCGHSVCGADSLQRR